MSNQIANLLLRKGYRRGQTVALYMESCPDFVITWLALTKIGVISALINTNLRKTPLKHCITAANCTAVIYSSETKEGFFINYLLIKYSLQREKHSHSALF